MACKQTGITGIICSEAGQEVTKMGNIIVWLIIMVPCSALFTGIGIYAWKRKKPMWFWSGSTVDEKEISDVPAYNRANGIMWIVFSLFMWLCTVLGVFRIKIAGILLVVGVIPMCIGLVIAYNRIYEKYRTKK